MYWLQMNMMRTRLLIPVVCLCWLAGCATPPAPKQTLSQAVLANMAYLDFEEETTHVVLKDGHWEGQPKEPGSALVPTVNLVDDLLVKGQVYGDATEEAVVLLEVWTGGTGVFTYLALVALQDGQAVNVGTALLGDRIQVRDVRIEQGEILVDAVEPGADDSVCCPSQKTVSHWQWQQGHLQRTASTIEGAPLSVADIGNQPWRLVLWGEDEAASADTVITLAWQDGHFAGSAGCNRYSMAVQDGQLPGEMEVSAQAAATRMACPEPAMSTKDRFLAQLAKANQFWFSPRGLAINYQLDNGQIGVMYFAVATDVATPAPVQRAPRKDERHQFSWETREDMP